MLLVVCQLSRDVIGCEDCKRDWCVSIRSDKKTEQANFARIEYQKILDEIRFYLRGEIFDEKVFLERLKMIDNFVTDHCMEILPSISKKYEKTFAPL